MDKPLLNDPAVFPDDTVLSRALGPAKDAWDAFMAVLKDERSLSAAEWRFYNDGQSWLFKVTRKTKTICWVAAWDNYFSVASYLNARAEPLVRASSLARELKDGFLSSGNRTKFRSIRIEVRKISDLKAVKELIEIKLKVK